MKHLKRICAGAYQCGNLHLVKHNSFWNVYEYTEDMSECDLIYSTRNFKSAREFVIGDTDIREVRIFTVNNRFAQCFVTYNSCTYTYKYMPKCVKAWIKGKYNREIHEERGDDFIITEIYKEV